MLTTVFKESLKGKSIYRTLTNVELGGRTFAGATLDIGGGQKRGSHYRFLRVAPGAEVKTVNVDPRARPDFVLDVTKEKIPLADNSQDAVFCFNTLEHLASWDNVLAETLRVLGPGGTFLGYIPFLVGVHADPHDYVRMTGEGLERAFSQAGFDSVEITPIGRGPFTAAYGQIEFLFPAPVHTVLIAIVLALDWVLRKIRSDLSLEEKYVLNYLFECRTSQ